MTYLSIIEKLKILFNMIFDNGIVLIFLISILFINLLYFIKVINYKKSIIFVLISLFITIITCISTNYDILSNTFDNFMTIFFSNIYFPSIYVYAFILLISLIVFIVSLFNTMLKKSYKIVNNVFFVMNGILFIIILNIIAKNKIDIFSNTMYSNINLVSILEINIIVFLLWIDSLIVIYITDVVSSRVMVKKSKVSNIDAVVNDEVSSSSYVNEVPFNEDIYEVNNNYDDISTDSVIVNDDSIIYEDNSNDTYDVISGNVPYVYYDKETATEEENEVINPKEIYDNIYSSIKNTDSFQDIVDDIRDKSIVISKPNKEKIISDNLVINSVSLEELDNNEVEDTKVISNNDDSYNIDDYKKFINMLNNIKHITRSSNISIDEAISISLINNYSLDDCIKFKQILESNLNQFRK